MPRFKVVERRCYDAEYVVEAVDASAAGKLDGEILDEFEGDWVTSCCRLRRSKMALATNWIQDAAEHIVGWMLAHPSGALTPEKAREIIELHCIFKYETAYIELPVLTPNEKRMLSMAAVGASSETTALLGLIERLTGHNIVPTDEESASDAD